MTAIDWTEHSELWRREGGMAVTPDPPIWTDRAVVAQGALNDMVLQQMKLPYSHQRHHFIVRTKSGITLDINDVQELFERDDFPKPGRRPAG